MVRRFFESRDDDALFRSSVGDDPSLADIVALAHPKPRTPEREALYAYLRGWARKSPALPKLVKEYEAFKNGDGLRVPEVPMEMLTALPLGMADWRTVAQRAPWQATRMNLNTFARHGVFGEEGRAPTKEEKEVTTVVADRLRNRRAIREARALPYQLMIAYTSLDRRVPAEVREALQEAMEVALANVPVFDGKVYLLPDVSGSMRTPVTGRRKGATSAVRCLDVAALVAAAVLRKNPLAEVLPFSDDVVEVALNPRDSVATNAAKLSALPSGGTSCSAPLKRLNRYGAQGDLVIFVSDNESWVDAVGTGQTTEVMKQWGAFRERNAKARLVCVDLQPNRTTQALGREDILNVGGFSDQVWETVAAFAAGRSGEGHWVREIEKIEV
jgi:60 kDa SS-A/Ro ribonucleoprotein